MPIINQVVKGSGGGSAPAHYIELTVDSNGVLRNNASTFVNNNGVLDVGNYGLFWASSRNPNLTNVDLSTLTRVSGNSAMSSCFQQSGITGLDMSSVIEITGNDSCRDLCRECPSLVSFDLSGLETVSAQNGLGYAFYKATNLTSVNLPSLKVASGFGVMSYVFAEDPLITTADLSCLTAINGYNGLQRIFSNDRALASVDLSSLTVLAGATSLEYAFSNTSLTTLSLPCLTPSSFGGINSQFNNMLYGVTGCTVHFPSNIQSTIGSWTSVTNGFGGTNTTVLFDLPATVTLTGADTVSYTRNPKYDTATALAWKVGAYGTTNFDTPYYTSGTTDPQVNDTIYSDSACTTAVTTISSIA